MAIDLAAIRARLEAASAGPWFWNSYSMVSAGPLVQAEEEYLEQVDALPEAEWDKKKLYELDSTVCWVPASHGDTATGRHADDAEFIAHAREDVAALLEECERLRARMRRADAVISCARRSYDVNDYPAENGELYAALVEFDKGDA